MTKSTKEPITTIVNNSVVTTEIEPVVKLELAKYSLSQPSSKIIDVYFNGSEPLPNEDYVPFLDYKGLNEVSNLLNYRSVNLKLTADGIIVRTYYKLKPWNNKRGRAKVKLYNGFGKGKNHFVSEGLKAFRRNPAPEFLTQIDHIDEDKSNNSSINNLQYISGKANREKFWSSPSGIEQKKKQSEQMHEINRKRRALKAEIKLELETTENGVRLW